MQWHKIEQSGALPEPRSSHSLTAVGEQLYVFGGEHDPRVPVGSELFRFDLASRVWEVVSAEGAPPSPRVAHSAAAIGPNIFVFGGRSGMEMAEGAMADLFRFDTSSTKWSAPAVSGDIPKRSFHAMVAVGTKLYVFGGCGVEDRLNDLWELDTAADTLHWRQLATSPDIKPRGGACLLASPDATKLLLLGGFCGEELSDAFEYSLLADSWAAAAPLPKARSVFGAAAVHGAVVVFGGEVDPSDKGHAGAGDFCDDLLCHRPGQGWADVAALGSPGPRGWYASAAAGGRFFVHGGLGGDNARLGDLYVLPLELQV